MNYRLYCKSVIRVLVLLLCIPLTAVATQTKDTPLVLSGGTIIEAVQVKELQEQGATLIDCRGAYKYGQGHIPGAILNSYEQSYQKDPSLTSPSIDALMSPLPEDKNTKIIFYSHGITGWKSYKAAVSAIENGYKNVYWFRGGLEAWQEQNFNLD